ncbi:hypothetical protein ACLOJK_012163 [Asimina triloba]
MALATSVIQPLSLGNCCLNSSSTSKPTPTCSFLSIPSKPLKHFLLFASHSSSSKNLPLWRRSLTASVAQTSGWAPRQDEDEESGFDWEGEQQQEGEGEGEGEGAEGAEAGLLEWDGEGEEGESGDEEDGGEDSYLPPPEEAKLFVGNLPYDVDSTSLAALFDQAGVVESAEVIYNRDTDQSRGFGFVVMSTVEEAEKAVEMFHRYVSVSPTLLVDLNGRSLNVNKAAPRGVRSERSPRVFEPSFRMYVGNLPWQVDDARLEQVFSEHGKVVDARVVYDRETGRSRGFGFVTMSSKTEVDDAIAALDGQYELDAEGASIVSVALVAGMDGPNSDLTHKTGDICQLAWVIWPK